MIDTLTAPTVAVRSLRSTEIDAASRLLADDVRTGFCDWEPPALAAHLTEQPDLCLAAVRGDRLVGVLVAGCFGVRGTVSHLAIAPDSRRTGLASRLADAVLSAFAARGVRRIFLFTTIGNDAAERFWERHGFRCTAPERTYERDLHEPPPV